jgi:hypothetical protein
VNECGGGEIGRQNSLLDGFGRKHALNLSELASLVRLRHGASPALLFSPAFSPALPSLSPWHRRCKSPIGRQGIGGPLDCLFSSKPSELVGDARTWGTHGFGAVSWECGSTVFSVG